MHKTDVPKMRRRVSNPVCAVVVQECVCVGGGGGEGRLLPKVDAYGFRAARFRDLSVCMVYIHGHTPLVRHPCIMTLWSDIMTTNTTVLIMTVQIIGSGH